MSPSQMESMLTQISRGFASVRLRHMVLGSLAWLSSAVYLGREGVWPVLGTTGLGSLAPGDAQSLSSILGL